MGPIDSNMSTLVPQLVGIWASCWSLRRLSLIGGTDQWSLILMFYNLDFLSTPCLAKMCGEEKPYVHTSTLKSSLLPCLSLHGGQYQLKMQGKINPSFFQLLLTRYLATAVRKETHANTAVSSNLSCAWIWVIAPVGRFNHNPWNNVLEYRLTQIK